MATDYWNLVFPTYIENWGRALHSLSIPSIDVPLSSDDSRRLGTNIIEFGEAFCETAEEREHNQLAAEAAHKRMGLLMTNKPADAADEIEFIKPTFVMEDISGIRAKVSDAVAKMPRGAFIRLGSRSPKDSWLLHKEGGRVLPDEDPLRFMLDCSERMYEDLMLAVENNYRPHIWVRQWVDIPRWSEFRCFMRDRKLVGISQYNYLDGEVFTEIDPDYCRWAIEMFFPSFLNATELSHVVFDVYLKTKLLGNSRITEVKLLEINPFFELTDPCLFSWAANDMDGSFRCN